MKKLFTFFSIFIFLCFQAQTDISLDTDKDGVPDKDDQCPNEFGDPINTGCPWPDLDKDGVFDKDDRCPTIPGDKNWEGCPSIDSDEDGVPDWFDRCLKIKGDIAHNGCPFIEDFEIYYQNLTKKINFNKIGDIIFENLDFKNVTSKILLVDVAYDSTNGVVSGTTDDEFDRNIIKSKYNFYYFWKANFTKFLINNSDKIIIPKISKNANIFISTKELEKYLDSRKFHKTKGFYHEKDIIFFVFNNLKKEKIEFKTLKDIRRPEVDIFRVFISNFYNRDLISISVSFSKSKSLKQFEFRYKDGEVELFNIKTEDL